MTTKTKTAADAELVVALDGLSVGPLTVHEGTRLRADHPVVQACPWNFVSVNVPDDELNRLRVERRTEEERGARESSSPPESEVKVLEPLPRRPDDVVAVRDVGDIGAVTSQGAVPVVGRNDALAVPAGTRLPKKHPLVRENPDAFVPVNPDRVPSERARRATEPVSTMDEDGETRTIHAGQLADRDDFLVVVNPHLFVAPEEEE